MDGSVVDGAVTIDGVRLECRWIGPGPRIAPTIVMLHEGLGSAAQWKSFPDRLAEETGCGVFVYSRQGYGASDPIPLPRPLTYMHDEAFAVLPKLLEAIGFRRGLLLGHSDGASIAAIYAGSIQDHRIRGLVLIAPHFFVEAVTVESIRRAKEAFGRGDLRERLRRYHGENVEAAFWGWNQAWLDPGFLDWNIQESLAHIRVPILIVQGADDPYGTTRQIEMAEAEAYCPVEVALLSACGHAPQLEQPAATLHQVVAFARHLLVDHGEARQFQA